MNMSPARRQLLAGAALAAVMLATAGCTASPHADVVRLDWATTTTTTTASTSTVPAAVIATAPSTTAPPPTTAPAPDQRLLAAARVPQSRLSWVCRTDPGPDGATRRHAVFVRNIGGSGLPDTSRQQVLAQLPRIEDNLDVYCTAEQLTGVPALVLAAIHYREANNDPTRSIMSGEPLGAVNPDTHVIEGTTLLDNALSAADHLTSGAAQIYGVTVDRHMSSIELAYTAAAFNRGGRYCRADQLHPMRSPYVAAGLVDANVGMPWPDLGSDDGGPESWGEPPSVRGRPDPRIGVLTILRGLGSEITAPAFSWNTDEVVIACR